MKEYKLEEVYIIAENNNMIGILEEKRKKIKL